MFQVAGGSVGLGIATTIVAAAAGSAKAGGHAGAAFVAGFQERLRVSTGLSTVGLVVTLLFAGSPLAALRVPQARGSG
jgi:hypothetical protein